MTRLSIGIVCFSQFGGSGVVAAELAGGLAERGHTVHLLATAPPTRVLPSHAAVPFHPVAVPTYPMLEHAPYPLALASSVAKVASQQSLDVVHAHYAIPHAVSVYLARQMLASRRFAMVVSLHGTDVTHVGQDPAYGPVTGFAVRAADGLTVPSNYLRNEAVERFGLTSERIEVITNFVNTEAFAPSPQPDPTRFDSFFGCTDARGPVLFHVSNFRPIKRTPDLIDVLVACRRTVPARLILVGDGPQREETAQRAHTLGVANHVCFLGPRADFANLLQHADAFVLPSEMESFGLAALESLSSGVPVFAYRVGGLAEVVSHQVGRLVPAFDTQALAQAILEVTGDLARHTAMRHAARQHAVDHFRRDLALHRYEDHYQRAITAAHARNA